MDEIFKYSLEAFDRSDKTIRHVNFYKDVINDAYINTFDAFLDRQKFSDDKIINNLIQLRIAYKKALDHIYQNGILII